MKHPETMWEVQNFETGCAWCVPSPETQHWERDAECKENTWPACLTSWQTASGWAVVRVHCVVVRLQSCLKAGPTQAPPGLCHLHAVQSKKKDFWWHVLAMSISCLMGVQQMLFNQLGNKGKELSICVCGPVLKVISLKMVYLSVNQFGWAINNQYFVEKAMHHPWILLPLQTHWNMALSSEWM